MIRNKRDKISSREQFSANVLYFVFEFSDERIKIFPDIVPFYTPYYF